MQEQTNDGRPSSNVNSEFLGDLTDGRPKGIWKTRYDLDAQNAIRWERNYLTAILLCAFLMPLALGISGHNCFWGLTCQFINLKKYAFGLLGGLLGGTLFSIKWLYHSVAKDTWNVDRRLWRIFTPHLSAGLALIIIVLINCQLLSITKPENLSIDRCYGIGFLVGYFSDNAIGKLTEIAQVLFGSSISKRK